MSSEFEIDPLRDVWQRQPVPALSPEAEVIIRRAVESEEARMKAETGSVPWWTLPLLLGPITVVFVRAQVGVIFWLLLAPLWGGATVAAIDDWLRVRREREFGASLLGRIDQICARLRLRLKWHPVLTAISTLLAAGVVSYLALVHGGSMLLGLVVVPLMVTGTVISASRQRRRNQTRLAQLESMRRELAA